MGYTRRSRAIVDRPPPPGSQLPGARLCRFRSLLPPVPWIMRDNNALLTLAAIVLSALGALALF